MPVYFITGKLGSGKSLVAVGRIYDYLSKGSRVATNMDIYTENLQKTNADIDLLRLPDMPTFDHLEQLGFGRDPKSDFDESKNGLIVLDECGIYLNSRSVSSEKIDRQKFVK